jgi:trehalose 6-phosphate synthase
VNLVVISNRVSRGKANEPMTGGLAAALLPVVEKSGAIWVGSSGRVRDGSTKEPFAEVEALGAGALAMLDLPAAHYGGYYEGFANSALWPALHSARPDPRVRKTVSYVRYHSARALLQAGLRVLDPGLSLLRSAELRSRHHPPIGFFLPRPARA